MNSEKQKICVWCTKHILEHNTLTKQDLVSVENCPLKTVCNTERELTWEEYCKEFDGQ